MEQYPSNSKRPERSERSREEPKKIESVVQGAQAVRRKPSLGRRMTQNLIGGDAQSVWGYVVGEVLIPAARDMMEDAFIGGIQRMIRGDDYRPSRSSRRGGLSSRTDYHSISNRDRHRREEPRRELSRWARSNHNFDEIVLDQRVVAEEVLDRMDALIDKYDVVSVAEFYELCGYSGSYTDRKYGWTDIRDAHIQHIRSGYLIKLPPPEVLD